MRILTKTNRKYIKNKLHQLGTKCVIIVSRALFTLLRLIIWLNKDMTGEIELAKLLI